MAPTKVKTKKLPAKPGSRRGAKTSKSTKPPGTDAAGAKMGPASKATRVAAQLPPVTALKVAAAKRKFEQGVLARSEAVPAGKPLPAGATHEIVGKTGDGSPLLKRKRFSLK